MTIPLLIAMVVAGASALFPPKTARTPSSSELIASPALVGNQVFLTGVAMGISISWLIRSELHRTRLHHRVRLAIVGWLRPLLTQSSDRNGSPPAGVTFQVAALQPSAKVAVSTFVSPATSLTSTLWVATIRIPPKHELQCQNANGVEFFLVLQGKGKWDIQIGGAGKTMIQGDAFTVEVNSPRWISNDSNEDLVLLRSSDAGYNHHKRGYDRIVPQNAPGTVLSTNLSAFLSSSIQQVGEYANCIFGN